MEPLKRAPRHPDYQALDKEVKRLEASLSASETEMTGMQAALDKLHGRLSKQKVTVVILEADLADFAGCASEIEALEASLAKKTVELAELEKTVDLNSDEQIASVTRLQTVLALLPRRLEARRTAAGEAEASLLDLCQQFVSSQLSPKVTDLAARARTKVRNSLGAHFAGADLDGAVEGASLVQDAERLRPVLTWNPLGGAANYARELLGLWNTAGAFETKLS